jgi:dienelactone hydrolase
MKSINGPISIAAVEDDFVFTDELRHSTERLFKETGRLYQITVYSGVQHGIAI